MQEALADTLGMTPGTVAGVSGTAAWTTTMSRTSAANPVRVPDVLSATAFTPSGTYLGVVAGPETTASC